MLCLPSLSRSSLIRHLYMQAMSVEWQRQRNWHAVPPRTLLARFAAKAKSVQLQTLLSAPALAYLWDHRVAGRALFPGAAMLEAAMAAGHVLLDGAAAAQPALCGVSIPAPLVLPEGITPLLLLTTIDAGHVRVMSAPSADIKGQTHLTGHVDQLAAAAPAAADVCSPQRTTCAALLGGQHAPAQYPPAACASLEHSVSNQQAAQYHVHPALTDCTTQVSSALNTSSNSVSRVPAGVGAFALPAAARSGTHMRWHAASALVGGEAAGAVECAFMLGPAKEAGIQMRIAGMLFKPAGALQQARTAGQEQLVYTVQVQAASVARPGPGSVVRPASSLEWQLGAKEAAHFVLPVGSSSGGLAALVASLPLLQHAVASPGQPHVSLFGTGKLGAGSAGRSNSLALGGAAGLLRVAAQEHKTQQFAHVSLDSLAPRAFQLPAAAAPDIYSTDMSHGVVYSQLLVPVPPSQVAASVATAHTANAFSNGVLVTGGLGDIGQLTGMWVAQTCPTARVWLLSRGGRPATHAHWLDVAGSQQAGCISTVSCDAASACDLAGLHAIMAAQHAPALTAIFHAGAVLRDGLLGAQTAQTLREVYAPKVLGGALLVQATLGLPVHSAIHFSSLSAQVRWLGAVKAR